MKNKTEKYHSVKAKNLKLGQKILYKRNIKTITDELDEIKKDIYFIGIGGRNTKVKPNDLFKVKI